jgi:hypothetical protein
LAQAFKQALLLPDSKESSMSALELKPKKLKCPFCSAISMRGTGLSAHVRARHSGEYRKWNKNPNRLDEAAAAASSQQEPKRHQVHQVRSPSPVKFGEAAPQRRTQRLASRAIQTSENDSQEALNLLQKAHQQLSTRKQTIESELERIEGLRGEHEAVTAQVAALEQALKAFKHQS